MKQPSLTGARVALVAILLSTGSSCHLGIDTSFNNHKQLAAAIANGDKVLLYEGLPHQTSEKELLSEELETKNTVQLNGFPFYAEPLPLKGGDAKKLTKLFTDSKSFEPHSDYKLCAGFHPDYCIEWQVSGKVYRCLICFGCYEVKAFGPKTELYCDIAKEAYDQFKEVLQPYRNQRPKPKEG
jgi:hypothetical protein